jgi:hypothetical protein
MIGLGTLFCGELLALTIRTRIPNVPIIIDDQQYLTDATGTLNARVSYASHLVAVSKVVQKENTRVVFDSWSDGMASLDRQINVQSDTSVDVNYKTQYRLNINSQYGSVMGADWYDQGEQASFLVTSPIQSPTKYGIRFTAVGFSGDAAGSGNSGTTVMDRPKTITFSWTTQYWLSISSSTSAVNAPMTSNWYNEGESVTVSAADTGRYRFLGWALDGAAKLESRIMFQMYAPRSLKANYGLPSTYSQNVEISSTSALSRYLYDEKNRVVSFVVSGDPGTLGFSTIRVPKQLLWSESPTVKIDGQVPLSWTVSDGGSVWILSFTYVHSDHTVAIPEFHQVGLMLALALSVVMILSRRAIWCDQVLSRRAS